jgi:hypothetical protein
LEKMRLKDQKSRQLTKEVCLIIPFCMDNDISVINYK